MQEKRNTKKKIVLASCLVTMVLVGVLVSYAYIVGITTEKTNPFSSSLAMGKMNLTFSDGDNGINTELGFGETVTKRFVIENKGSLETSLSLDWSNIVNTYLNGSLTYNLSYSETEDGGYTNIVEETNMPTSDTPISRPLASELSVPAGKTYYYNLSITLNNLENVDQMSDLSAKFNTEFQVGQPSKYRYYNLRVDPNGGEWNSFSSPQEYKLKNDETMEIENPTKVGYTFTGWSIDGLSSELNGNTFSMGISDAILKANWKVNEYTVRVDGEDMLVAYGNSITLSAPTKEGYTFTGWNKTGGTLENNTFTLTEAKDIEITSIFTVNNYKYIVYHNQMNTSGFGYTLVSADTDEGEAAFGSVISPSTRIYTGFTAPSKKSITIGVEIEYPPVRNRIDYNYDRNKYKLTINPNGGVYAGEVGIDLYYGASTILGVPTKTGYNFTNWTKSGNGEISGNEYTMGEGNTTLSANYTPKTYSVTFNANGGVVGTQSKTVTYDSVYGDLPEPTYSGYRFLGWFTSSTGGLQVTSSSVVALTDNQTLFAHWEKSTVTVTLIAENLPANNVNGAVGGGYGYFESTGIKTKTITVTLGQPYGDIPNAKGQYGVGGYEFQGWYDAASGGTKVTSTTIVTNNSDHNLYAYYKYHNCFVEGTLVYTPNGYVEIQNLKVGDKVYSYNEKTKTIEEDIISKTMVSKTREYLKIRLSDSTIIEVTSSHPFYDSKHDVWKPISEFKEGDALMTSEKRNIEIESIEKIEKEITVYNLEVKNNHTYFVSDSDILVHNKAGIA